MLPGWVQNKPTRKMRGLGNWNDAIAKNVASLGAAEASGPLDFVLYGDSITAFLHGYAVNDKVKGTSKPWKKHFGSMRAVALGAAGDQIGNLYWRIVYREQPAADPKVFGLHIGINDLIGWGSGGVPPTPSTIERLKQLVSLLVTTFPTSKVVVFALTPCNGTELRKKRAKFNKDAKDMVAAFPGRAFFVDCAKSIAAPNGGPSKSGILADGVHLTEAGHDKHLLCMRKEVDKLLKLDKNIKETFTGVVSYLPHILVGMMAVWVNIYSKIWFSS